MKVLVSCRDSGSLKEYTFTKDTDTSDPDSPKPDVQTFLAEKFNPVVKFCVSKYGLILARKKGHVGLYTTGYEHVKDIGTCEKLVGLDFVDDSLYFVNEDGKGQIYNFETEKLTTFELPGGLSITVKHPTKPVILYSGPKLNPALRSLDDGKDIYQSRHKPGKHDIPEKNLVTNAVFLTDIGNDYHFATVTSNGKVRVYNTGHGKKPVSQDEVSKFALKALVYFEGKLVIGDFQSKVGLYEISPKNRLLGFYPDIVGATSCVTARKDLIVTVGLDRYIHLYNGNKRSPCGKVYVGEELEWAEILQDDEEKRALDEDEFWDDIKNTNKKLKTAAKENKETVVEDKKESQIEEHEDNSEDELSEENSEDEVSEFDSLSEESGEGEGFSDSE